MVLGMVVSVPVPLALGTNSFLSVRTGTGLGFDNKIKMSYFLSVLKASQKLVEMEWTTRQFSEKQLAISTLVF